MIQKEFTYLIPDIFGTTSTKKGLTQSAVYKGPAEFFVQISSDNKVDISSDILDVSGEAILESWVRDENTAVKVKATSNLLLSFLIAQYEDDEDNEEDTGIIPEENLQHYYLEGESEPFFTHIVPIGVNEIYDVDNITYDKATDKFKIPMLDHSNPDEGDVVNIDELVQEAVDYKEENSLDNNQIILIDQYIKDLKSIPTKYKNWPKHMWPDVDFPIEDEIEDEK